MHATTMTIAMTIPMTIDPALDAMPAATTMRTRNTTTTTIGRDVDAAVVERRRCAKVAMPAIFMMVLGGLGLVFAIVRTIIDLTMGGQCEPQSIRAAE